MMDAADLQRTLIVRTDRIGDVILTLPMIAAIRRIAPDAHITFLCTRYTLPLLETHAGIDGCIVINSEDDVPTLPDVIRKQAFTAAFAPSPTRAQAQLLRDAAIPVRVSTAYRWYSGLFTDRVREHRKYAWRNEAAYNVRMVSREEEITPGSHPARITVDPTALGRARAWLQAHGVREGRFAIIHPGSGGSALDLPPERFGAVAERLRAECGLDVVVTGTAKEAGLATIVERTAATLVPRFFDQPLADVVALTSLAKIVVANSTGVLHIAAAVGTAVVGLYPPIVACSPKRWGPWSTRAVTLIPEVGMDCRSCSGPACEFHDCMRLIPVSSIIASVRSLLNAEVVA
jgi:heptosyltransferase-3